MKKEDIVNGIKNAELPWLPETVQKSTIQVEDMPMSEREALSKRLKNGHGELMRCPASFVPYVVIDNVAYPFMLTPPN